MDIQPTYDFKNPEGSKELYKEISDLLTEFIKKNINHIIADIDDEVKEQYDSMLDEILNCVNSEKDLYDSVLDFIYAKIAVYVIGTIIKRKFELYIDAEAFEHDFLYRNYNEYAVAQWENMDINTCRLLCQNILCKNPQIMLDVLSVVK